MATRRKKTSPGKEIKRRKICVFIFAESVVYVDKTAAGDLWRYYDNHYRERITTTKASFRSAKETDEVPSFYLLEEMIGTDAEAFARCIAWSKHFLTQGYQLLSSKMLDLVQELDETTNSIYQTIQTVSLAEVCDESKRLFSEFRKHPKRKRAQASKRASDVHRVELLVREKEYRKWKARADGYGVALSEYIMDCVRLGGVFQVDTSFMEEYTRELLSSQNLMRGLLTTYLITGEYTPADMQRLQEICDRVAERNGAAVEEIGRLCRKLTRMKSDGL